MEHKKSVIESFRQKSEGMFCPVGGCTAFELEEIVREHTRQKIQEYGLDAGVVDVVVVGSRCRGLEKNDSDLDIVVEYTDREREDVMFEVLNEDEMHIGNVKLDINPITKGKSGSLEGSLTEAERYLEEKRKYLKRNRPLHDR